MNQDHAKPAPLAQPTLVWAALLTVYVLWGSTYLGIRVAVETMPPFLMAGIRFMLAGALLCAWRLPAAIRSGKAPTATHWRRALVIGALLLLGGNGGVAFAELTVPSGLTALVVASVPLWMALIDRFFYGRSMPAAAFAGVLAGFGGVALLGGTSSSGNGGGVPVAGLAVLIVASLSWATGSLYSRGARMPDDSFLATGMEMLAGGLCLTILAVVSGEVSHVDICAISTASWIAFGYLVLFGGVVGFSAYLWALSNAPTSLVSTYAYVNPVVAVLLGWAVLHEQLTARTLLAGAIIVASVASIVSANTKSGQ